MQTNVSLDNLNPRLPRLQYGLQRLAEGLISTPVPARTSGIHWTMRLTTIRTLNNQRGDWDATLCWAPSVSAMRVPRCLRMAVRTWSGRCQSDSDLEAAQHLQPELYCMLRKYAAELLPDALAGFGGNGYSLADHAWWARPTRMSTRTTCRG